jgi:peptidoglycan-N-acetylglucosamine deacetylase
MPSSEETRMRADGRMLELLDFVDRLDGVEDRIRRQRLWIHSRWYASEDFGRVLDVAVRTGARMTFAFLGRDVPHRRAVIERMVAEGHEVITHGARHYRIDERLTDDQLFAELEPCVAELRGLGLEVPGIYLGDSPWRAETARVLDELGFDWACGRRIDPADALDVGPEIVPLARPTDAELFLYEQTTPDEALATWRRMAAERAAGAWLFHPFSFAYLDGGDDALRAWSRFLEDVGGSVPVSERARADGRPVLLFDSSLSLGLR